MNDPTVSDRRSPTISERGYLARRKFIQQYEEYLSDPNIISEPDYNLLLIDAEFGPFEKVSLRVEGGRTLVAVKILDPKASGPRLFHPLDYAALSLIVGFGMGVGFHDNGKGTTPEDERSYLRIRISDVEDDAVFFARVMLDARPGTDVRRKATTAGQVIDHRRYTRDAFKIVQGRGFRGRLEVLNAARSYASRWSETTGQKLHVDEHVWFIGLALRLGDREHAARSALAARNVLSGPDHPLYAEQVANERGTRRAGPEAAE